jgi:hypothetical protein
LILVFIVGSRVVYACKVAQANLFPTNMECFPYTDVMPEFEEKNPEVSIDVIKIYNKDSKTYESYSTKLIFSTEEDNLKQYFLDHLRKMAKNPKISRLAMYMVDVLNNLFSSNFGAVSFILNIMNSMLTESMIIILGPIILYYLVIGAYLVNMVLGIIVFIICAGRLLQKNTNNDSDDSEDKTDDKDKPVWLKTSLFSMGTLGSIFAAGMIAWIFTLFVATITK